MQFYLPTTSVLFDKEPLARATVSDNCFLDYNKLSPEAVKLSPDLPHCTSFNQTMRLDTTHSFVTDENFVDFPADTTDRQRYSSRFK